MESPLAGQSVEATSCVSYMFALSQCTERSTVPPDSAQGITSIGMYSFSANWLWDCHWLPWLGGLCFYSIVVVWVALYILFFFKVNSSDQLLSTLVTSVPSKEFSIFHVLWATGFIYIKVDMPDQLRKGLLHCVYSMWLFREKNCF